MGEQSDTLDPLFQDTLATYLSPSLRVVGTKLSRFGVLLPVLLLTAGPSAAARDYQTKHLFIVVIDGVRNDEAFDDSTHRFIPRMWNDMRPLGTIFTEFYSTSLTHTTSGHTALVSGTRNNYPNADTLECIPFRPRSPTMFEYFRKHGNVARNRVWSIAGKSFLHSIEHSLHPEYGQDFGAFKIYNAGDDSTTMGILSDVIDQFHPSLVMLNLRDVDCWGHTQNWEKYTRAICIADSLVWELWQRLENDIYYGGKTTLLVTTDHGRHDDLHGGFPHHGGTDHGSQHLLFLTLGPDIKQDTVITHRRDMTDIVPTVGELLGFPTPYTEGKPLFEMIVPPAGNGWFSSDRTRRNRTGEDDRFSTRITETPSMSVSPSVALTGSYLHLVWTEEDSLSSPEKKRLMYTRRDEYTGQWESPVPLFADIDSLVVLAEGRLTSSDGIELAAVARSCVELYDQLDKPTYKWFPLVTTSTEGDGWSPTTAIVSFAKGSREIIPTPPAVYSSTTNMTVGWITGARALAIKRSTDGGATFSTVTDIVPESEITQYYLLDPVFLKGSSKLFTVGECNFHHSSRLFCGGFRSTMFERTALQVLDEGIEPSTTPAAGATSSKLHFVWSEFSSGNWRICYRNANLEGAELSDILSLSNSPGGAMNPCIAARNDSLMVVWEDYRYGAPDLYMTMSIDEGIHWYVPSRLTTTPGSSINPSLVWWEDQFSVAWQDDSDGNWEIYLQEQSLGRAGKEALHPGL